MLRKESRFRNKPGEQQIQDTHKKVEAQIQDTHKIRHVEPVSRVLSRTIIHLGCTSPYTSSSLPGDNAGHIIAPLFGLAPGGVYHAVAVASHAVRSYRTISPLPGHLAGRYTFCCTFRRLAPPRNYLAPCPCGARTFLCRTGIDKKSIRSDSDCPADSRSGFLTTPNFRRFILLTSIFIRLDHVQAPVFALTRRVTSVCPPIFWPSCVVFSNSRRNAPRVCTRYRPADSRQACRANSVVESPGAGSGPAGTTPHTDNSRQTPTRPCAR